MSIRREHAAQGLGRRRLKRKLGLDYEPAAPPDLPEDSEHEEDAPDGTIEELVSAAIDSSAPEDDTDSSDDLDSPQPHAGNPSLTPSSAGPLILTPMSLHTSAEVGSSHATRRARDRPIHIPLQQLFLYPSKAPQTPDPVPSENPTPPSTSFVPADPAALACRLAEERDADLRQRFDFIWKGGIRKYENETLLCELLHPGSD